MTQPTGFSDMNGEPIHVGDILDIFGVEAKVIENDQTPEKFWARMPNGVEAPLWAKFDICTVQKGDKDE